MQTINQYSFFVISGIILLVGAVLVLRRGLTVPRVLGVAGAALLVLGVWFAIRPQQTPDQNAARIEEQIGAGKPVLLEFQSPY